MFGFDSDMIFRIPALLAALTIHEYAHARMAVSLGDPTPKYLGRLTLNPVAHLDPIGLIMLWLFRFGWAKPVPFNPYNFQDVKKDTMLVAFAGPASNILLAFTVAVLMGGILPLLGIRSFVIDQILIWTYQYNLGFAVFNLLPIPPLDGSKILGSLLPGRQAEWWESIEQYAPMFMIALLAFGFIGPIISPLINSLHRIIMGIVGIIF
ncbi:site-2 protease family protein [Acetonema longum]|uniref:Peptidase M50 n=1 Tax=Acetonema longum DSM 6540 TaxID=1009370 RepID=F7NK10_9FIRM|nr:site-2 protease family protein [Acetonema longum]EGO63657.1 peptidase M50 [Acetonema longum DSM 6540]